MLEICKSNTNCILNYGKFAIILEIRKERAKNVYIIETEIMGTCLICLNTISRVCMQSNENEMKGGGNNIFQISGNKYMICVIMLIGHNININKYKLNIERQF